jgi:hypothetical protein
MERSFSVFSPMVGALLLKRLKSGFRIAFPKVLVETKARFKYDG